MSIGEKIREALPGMVKIIDVNDYNRIWVWSSNSDEQLEALVEDYVQQRCAETEKLLNYALEVLDSDYGCEDMRQWLIDSMNERDKNLPDK